MSFRDHVHFFILSVHTRSLPDHLALDRSGQLLEHGALWGDADPVHRPGAAPAVLPK